MLLNVRGRGDVRSKDRHGIHQAHVGKVERTDMVFIRLILLFDENVKRSAPQCGHVSVHA
jgi:hypothetical protein